MSRHFNYELDERRIKILLKENSMPYSEDVWNEFLSKTKPINKVNKLPNFKPISFAVNKNVVLTGIFILLIGSFTLLIANYIDFGSSRKNSTTEREVIPEPENFKLTKVTTSLPVKKEIVATQENVAKDTTAVTTESVTVQTPATTQSIADETKSLVPVKNEEQYVVTKIKQDTSAVNSRDSNGVTQNDKYRKKKKKQAETLESKPLTTELPTPEEPELELK